MRDRGEIEPGKDDIEASEPCRILPAARWRMTVYLLGDHHIEHVEPLEPVAARQQIVDACHHLEHVSHRRWLRSADDFRELVVNSRIGHGMTQSHNRKQYRAG